MERARRRNGWQRVASPPMATKLCPDCAEQVPTTDVTCRHCGHAFGSESPERPTTRTWPKVLFVIGILVAIVGLVVVSQGLVVLGLIVGAGAGYVWRFEVRRARAGG